MRSRLAESRSSAEVPASAATIEDENTIREGICYALTRSGYEPVPFDDGQTAWERLSDVMPDLVILDIGLPRMDGLEVCRLLRTRSDRLPIIFVTSREEEFDRVLGLEIGADDSPRRADGCPSSCASTLPRRSRVAAAFVRSQFALEIVGRRHRARPSRALPSRDLEGTCGLPLWHV